MVIQIRLSLGRDLSLSTLVALVRMQPPSKVSLIEIFRADLFDLNDVFEPKPVIPLCRPRQTNKQN